MGFLPFIMSVSSSSGNGGVIVDPPTQPFADLLDSNGWLNVFIFAQSNGVAIPPPANFLKLNEGSKTNPTNGSVYVVTHNRQLGVANYQEVPFLPDTDNMFLVFARMFAEKYNIRVNLCFEARGGRNIQAFMPANTNANPPRAEDGDRYDELTTMFTSMINSGLELPKLVMQHQGEANNTDANNYANLRQEYETHLISQGWIASNPKWIFGEIFYEGAINAVFENLRQSNPQKYNVARSNQCQKYDQFHATGASYEMMGARYLQALEEMYELNTESQLSATRPPRPSSVTATAIDATGFTLNWTSVAGAARYRIYHVNGMIEHSVVDAPTLSQRVDFLVNSGETESFYVLAEYADGRTSWFLQNTDIDVVRP